MLQTLKGAKTYFAVVTSFCFIYFLLVPVYIHIPIPILQLIIKYGAFDRS